MRQQNDEGEEAWESEVGQAPEFLVLVDGSLRVVYLSRAPAGLGDVPGTLVTDYMPAEYHEPIRRAAAVALETKRPQHFQGWAAGPDGERSWYSVWIVPTDGQAHGARLALIATDVTHRFRVEAALEEERSLLRSLVDHAPDYILIVDREHRVRFINRIDRGFSEDQLVGSVAEDFLPEHQRAEAHAVIESVFETGKGASYEVEVRTPVGSYWYSTRVGPVLREGRVDRVSLVSTDVTEARKLEQIRAAERESLRQSEARFRTLVDSAPEAVVIFDVEVGCFVDANEKASELFELSREELLQRGPVELSAPTTPDGRPSSDAVRETIERAIEGEQPAFEWTHRTGSGRDVPCEVRLVRLPHPDRVLLRASLIDISQRLHAEAERARLNDELFQARKMQAIGQLTGGVAHDFNNLLTVITGHAELLRYIADDPTKVVAHGDQILEASQRAARLTQQLLAYSRRQALQPRAVDLSLLVANLENLLRRTLGETVEVRTHLPAELWSCQVDPAQLENALLNLAINARDAMPQGGVLTIAAENLERPPPEAFDASAQPPPPHVLLSVRDTGSGMTPEVQAQAFEPFFTTKDVGRGSGLGLSMVYGFVRQSGGQVCIESAPGRGTEVAIYLPRAEAVEIGVQDSRPPADPLLSGEGQLVLVVEDDEQVRAATVEGLERQGYRTVEAPDAAAAMRVLEETPEVALLLTDVVLPGGASGPELVRRASARYPELPVVYMSGYPREGLVEDARLPPEVILLRKPFTLAKLGSAVRRGLRPQPRRMSDEPGASRSRPRIG